LSANRSLHLGDDNGTGNGTLAKDRKRPVRENGQIESNRCGPDYSFEIRSSELSQQCSAGATPSAHGWRWDFIPAPFCAALVFDLMESGGTFPDKKNFKQGDQLTFPLQSS